MLICGAGNNKLGMRWPALSFLGETTPGRAIAGYPELATGL